MADTNNHAELPASTTTTAATDKPNAIDPSVAPPSFEEFKNDFKPTAADIDAVHGQQRNEEQRAQDAAAIAEMETTSDTVRLPHRWLSPWFECKDLRAYQVDKDPNKARVEFQRLYGQYHNVLNVYNNNIIYGGKYLQNRASELSPVARIDQACNGDLVTVERRRKHLIGLISYCWQLVQLVQQQQEYDKVQQQNRAQREERDSKKKKKKDKEKKKEKEKDKGGKKDSSKKKKGKKNEPEAPPAEEEDDDDGEEEKEADVPQEPNPYDWGGSSPMQWYHQFLDVLIAVFYLCICGIVPHDEAETPANFSRTYDAAHVVANHMAKLSELFTRDNHSVLRSILQMFSLSRPDKIAWRFFFRHHLYSCINFESKHSSQSLQQQAQQLSERILTLDPASNQRRREEWNLQQVEERRSTAHTTDALIAELKARATEVRTNKQTKKLEAYPDVTYLRVSHELNLQELIPIMSQWGIVDADFDRIWRKIDNGALNSRLRRIICDKVSTPAKRATAMDIEAHKLGIGPDYVKKKYVNMVQLYEQHTRELATDDRELASLMAADTDFLNHHASQDYNTADAAADAEENAAIAGLREDQMETTAFAHMLLRGQFGVGAAGAGACAGAKPGEQSSILEKPAEVAAISRLPDEPAVLSELLRRRQRKILGMRKQYGLGEDEIQKMLHLSDNRALLLPPEEFYSFYGLQPTELVHKFMDPELSAADRQSMSSYLKFIIDQHRQLRLEKEKATHPHYHFGSLRSAVQDAQHKAMQRVDHTKQKYTEEYLSKLQLEYEHHLQRLTAQKQKQRELRRQRIAEINRLQQKKNERLTTVSSRGGGGRDKDGARGLQELSPQDHAALQTLQENQELDEQNEQTAQQNAQTQQDNDAILERFFTDAEDKQLQLQEQEQNQPPEHAEHAFGGDDAFLNREASKNYGKIVADQTAADMGGITEVFRRRRTMSQAFTQQLLQDPTLAAYASNTASPNGSMSGLHAGGGGSNKEREDRLSRLLNQIIGDASIPSELKQEAKLLLSASAFKFPGGVDKEERSPHAQDGDSVSSQRRGSVVLHEDDVGDKSAAAHTLSPKENILSPPPADPTHRTTGSVVVHDEDALREMKAESASDHEEHDYEDAALKKAIDAEDDDDDEVAHNLNLNLDTATGGAAATSTHVGLHGLPFDDIDPIAKDLSWLDNDELVPTISKKDMLDAAEISRLYVHDVPNDDTLAADLSEQRERQRAVEKYEKSHMSDEALKKLQQKQAEAKAREERLGQYYDSHKEMKELGDGSDLNERARVMNQGVTGDEKEWTEMTAEEKEERRRQRRERNKYTGRASQTLQKLPVTGPEEETVLVSREVDDFEEIAVEESEAGQHLVMLEKVLKRLQRKYDRARDGDLDSYDDDDDEEDDDEDAFDTGQASAQQREILAFGQRQMYEYLVKHGVDERHAMLVTDHGVTGLVIETAIVERTLDALLSDIGLKAAADVSKVRKLVFVDEGTSVGGGGGGAGGGKFSVEQRVIFALGQTEMFEHIVEHGVREAKAVMALDHGLTGLMIETAIADKTLDTLLSDIGFETGDFPKLRKMLHVDDGKSAATKSKSPSKTAPKRATAVVDKRQEKIFAMNARELYAYIVDKGVNAQQAAKALDHGLNGTTVEIAIGDNALDAILKDVGFEFADVAKLLKVLQFDGWKQKQSYPITMTMEMFQKWVEKKCGADMAQVCVNHGLDGKSIGLCIEDGGNALVEVLQDVGITDAARMETLRHAFVLDSCMVPYWTPSDVAQWLQSKLSTVKSLSSVLAIVQSNGVDGSQLLAALNSDSNRLSQLGVDESVVSKIRGKMSACARDLSLMDEVEVMYWLHSIPMAQNTEIARQFYQQGVTGAQLLAAGKQDLAAFLESKLSGSSSSSNTSLLNETVAKTVLAHGGFVPNYLIQDPNIVDMPTSTASAGKKSLFMTDRESAEFEQRQKVKIAERGDKLQKTKKRHAKLQNQINFSAAVIVKDDGRKYVRLHKGKKTVKIPQRMKNYSKHTIALQKASSFEQERLQKVRKMKYQKRLEHRKESHARVSRQIDAQVLGGISGVNELQGIPEEDYSDMSSHSSDSLSSEEAFDDNLRMLHKSTMSTHRLADRLEYTMDVDDEKQGVVPTTRKESGVGAALQEFIEAGDKRQFHRRRASSIVQNILQKSKSEMKNTRISRKMSRRMTRGKSIFGGSGVVAAGGKLDVPMRHSRQYSSGHFVSQFMKKATDREKIEAGMRGEQPLVIYYCDKRDDEDEERMEVIPISILDTYLDDYTTFDDYIKILSKRLESAQRRHRNEMVELRRHKDDLTTEVVALRTKKEEIIRWIGQERSLILRELPDLQKAKKEANAAQDQYESGEAVMKEKFNETKLHVMMMMQFRDNHHLKLNEQQALQADIKAKIQVLQSEIEELLAHFFTLQNMHNRLEHTVALLSELTTMCHEVNVRKKTEYEQEIKDLLAMIARYRCRIRNVDRLIEQYQTEVVELRMLNEQRTAEYKKLSKNPTTNRTVATIDYYVSQRKLYEEKAKLQLDSFEDFIATQQKYNKQLATLASMFKHYEDRSKIADRKYKSEVGRKNALYNECRVIAQSLGYERLEQAEEEFNREGNPFAQEYYDQIRHMQQMEEASKKLDKQDVEFVDVDADTMDNLDAMLPQKTTDMMKEEQRLADSGQMDRIKPDIESALQQSGRVRFTRGQDVWEPHPDDADVAQKMARVHRGDDALDAMRAPMMMMAGSQPQSMSAHVQTILDQTNHQMKQHFEKTRGRPMEELVNVARSTFQEDFEDPMMAAAPQVKRRSTKKSGAKTRSKGAKRPATGSQLKATTGTSMQSMAMAQQAPQKALKKRAKAAADGSTQSIAQPSPQKMLKNRSRSKIKKPAE